MQPEPDINERDRNDYFTPSQRLFQDHCQDVVRHYGLDDDVLVCKESVRDIGYSRFKRDDGEEENIFTVLTDVSKWTARIVVLAVGAANTPLIPSIPVMHIPGSKENGYQSPPQMLHSSEIAEYPASIVRDRVKARQTTNILVIGGGLTSAQLSDLAVRRGVTKVWHLMRGHCRVKPFDIDIEWMGKYGNRNQLAFWNANSDEERLDILQKARGGGSITPVFHERLTTHISQGRVELHTNTVLEAAQFDPEQRQWSVRTSPPIERIPPMDFIYFATGVQTDINTLPYLQTLLEQHPIKTLRGFPVLTNDLMWLDHVPLFVAGKLSALRLGPSAPNLGGAKVGAERIASMIQDIVAQIKGGQKVGREKANDNDIGSEDAEDPTSAYYLGRGNKFSRLQACY